jgi:hypothetical protein
MSTNDALAFIIAVIAFTTSGMEIALTIKCPEQRWLRVFKAWSSAWVGMVFLLNFLNVAVAGPAGEYIPPLLGRPSVLALIATMLAGAIWQWRLNKHQGKC